MSIKRIREEKALSQSDLAEILSVDRSTIAKWETGASAPRVETLRKLANYFDCSIDELLNDAGTTVRPENIK